MNQQTADAIFWLLIFIFGFTQMMVDRGFQKRLDLHWEYMKSLNDSLDLLCEAIKAVDAKVDGKAGAA